MGRAFGLGFRAVKRFLRRRATIAVRCEIDTGVILTLPRAEMILESLMTRLRAAAFTPFLIAPLLACVPLADIHAAPITPASASDSQPILVEVAIAKRAPMVRVYEMSGSIEAAESVPASFRDGGRLISLDVQVGDAVAAEQVLAQIDPTQAQAAERAAQAGLLAAEASVKQAQLARDRAEELANRGAGTRAVLDAATEALMAAQSARDQAQAGLDKAAQTSSDTVIRAGSDAIVTDRSAEAGQVVAPGQPVLTLARNGAREAVFYAPDTAHPENFFGKTLHLRTLDGPELLLTAQLTEISPLAAASTGTVRVKAQLDPTAQPPALGVSVVGSVTVEDAAVFSLPWTVTAQSAQGAAVWRVDPDTHSVALVPVVLARHGSQTVEIASGLEEGDLIVAAGSQLLYPGRVVSFEAPTEAPSDAASDGTSETIIGGVPDATPNQHATQEDQP
jgi:RND family efflux transporter MFP subunit